MSTATDQRRQTRIISKATAAPDAGQHETVNVVTSVAGDVHKSIKEHVQLTGANTKAGVHETLIDSAGSIKGLRTIFVSGYTAPN